MTFPPGLGATGIFTCWQDAHREFTPELPAGARVVWRLYDGDHSWPDDASGWVVSVFQQI